MPSVSLSGVNPENQTPFRLNWANHKVIIIRPGDLRGCAPKEVISEVFLVGHAIGNVVAYTSAEKWENLKSGHVILVPGFGMNLVFGKIRFTNGNVEIPVGEYDLGIGNQNSNKTINLKLTIEESN